MLLPSFRATRTVNHRNDCELETAREVGMKNRLRKRPAISSLLLAFILLVVPAVTNLRSTTPHDDNVTSSAVESRADKNHEKSHPKDASSYKEEDDASLWAYEANNITEFCVPWERDTDAWWTHHPWWYISLENDTHYCFRYPIEKPKKVQFFQSLYGVQSRSGCSNVTTKRMWSDGWGSDTRNLMDGLHHAVTQTSQPFQVTSEPWHYAAKQNATACPLQNMYAYFLNLTQCPTVAVGENPVFERS